MKSFALLCKGCLSFSTRKAQRALGATLAVLLFSLPVFCQLNTGRISGAITDQSGGAVAAAKVAVTEVATGVARSLTTDGAGQYAAPNLTPGVYTVHVEFMGFQTVDRQNVTVNAGGDLRIDLTLQPGAQTQTVTVTEAIPIMNTTNAQTGGTLENNLLANLPVNGRNYRWLIEFVPGVMTTPGEGTTSSSTNGGGTDWANFMVDGLYDQSPYSKQSSVGGAGEAGDTTLVPLDAIQEVALITNPKAEYGWDPGVTINVALKSGTNAMHGTAFAFGRDQALDARNAFALDRGSVQFEQWGATLGGPIKKDKLFYFGGYESERVNVTSEFTVKGDPTTAVGQGTSISIPEAIADFNAKKASASPPAGISALTLSPLSLNIAGCDATNGNINSQVAATVATACGQNQYGAPGLFNNYTNTSNPSYSFPQYGGSDNAVLKVDYHLSDHHSISGSYFFGQYHEYADASAAVTQAYWDEVLSVRSQMARGVEIWTPNSSWLNEARVGWDHDSRPVTMADCSVNGDTSDPLQLSSASKPGQFGAPVYAANTAGSGGFNLLSGAPACGLPTIKLNSVGAQLGFGNNRSNFESDVQGADTVSYTRGTHQFKFGVDIRAESFNGVKVQDSQRGTITFGGAGALAFTGATSLESFLTGVPSSETVKLGNAIRTPRWKLIAVFAQDDWRIVPRLTLNIGVRWEMQTANKDDGGQFANFDPTAASGMVQSNQLWPTQNFFSPHLGFAWDVTGKGTTTVRAGGGVAYVVPQLQNWITSQTDDLSAMPTAATLYKADGSTIQGPGNINNILQTLVPVSSNGTFVTSGQLPWSAGNPLFLNTGVFKCGNGLPATVGASVNPQTCLGYGADPHVKFPQMITWNVNVQHAFSNTLSLDLGYIGSHSSDITGLYNLNQPTPGNKGSTIEQARQPYTQFPWFSNILSIADVGGSNYAALQAYLSQRVSHGLNFTVGYTFSHALGIQGGPGTGTGAILNLACPKCEYGNLNTDAPHHFSLTANYNIPGVKTPGQMLEGWALNSSVNILNALPLNILDSSLDTSGTGGKIDRWTLYGPASPFNSMIGGAGTIPCYALSTGQFGKSGSGCITVANAASFPTACIAAANAEPNGPIGVTNNTGLTQLSAIGCYMVNGSAIVPPAQGTFGNMTRNELRGKPFSVWNASVTKEWKIKERLTTQFRAEFFNILNQTMYSGVGVNLGAPSSFGAAASTPDVNKSNPVVGSGGPREIQLGLKFLF